MDSDLYYILISDYCLPMLAREDEELQRNQICTKGDEELQKY